MSAVCEGSKWSYVEYYFCGRLGCLLGRGVWLVVTVGRLSFVVLVRTCGLRNPLIVFWLDDCFGILLVVVI